MLGAHSTSGITYARLDQGERTPLQPPRTKTRGVSPLKVVSFALFVLGGVYITVGLTTDLKNRVSLAGVLYPGGMLILAGIIALAIDCYVSCSKAEQNAQANQKRLMNFSPPDSHYLDIVAKLNKHCANGNGSENPERIEYITKNLMFNRLHAHIGLFNRMATTKELLLCHTSTYLSNLENTALSLSPDMVEEMGNSLMINSESITAAKLAVGCVLNSVDKVFANPKIKMFCPVRPPGHHAEKEKGMGFCIFNHVAIAARYAQQKYKIERVLIIDWDVHHGNGTENIFYNDKSVFFFSTHSNGLFPAKTGCSTHQGAGRGIGYNMNVPINRDEENPKSKVIDAFETQLVPAMANFKPQLVLISCGFDSHKGDPFGNFNLSDQDFVTLTEIANNIADTHAEGRLVSVLEGGYSKKNLISGSLAHVLVLSQDSPV